MTKFLDRFFFLMEKILLNSLRLKITGNEKLLSLSSSLPCYLSAYLNWRLQQLIVFTFRAQVTKGYFGNLLIAKHGSVVCVLVSSFASHRNWCWYLQKITDSSKNDSQQLCSLCFQSTDDVMEHEDFNFQSAGQF